jgi:hypothetical protein
VKISKSNGRVIEWGNGSGNLQVALQPGGHVTTSPHFTQGSHKDDVLRLQGTPSDIDRYPALGHEIWRYGLSTVKVSLATDEVVEFANSGNLRCIHVTDEQSLPITYHHTSGDVQLYYDESKVYSGVLSFSDDMLGDIYGATSEGVMYFYDSSLRPLDLYAYADEDESIAVGTFKESHSDDALSDFRSRLSFIDVSGDISASGTAMRFGDMTFYDLISDSGTSVHGTSMDFENIGFDNFYSSTRVSASGSRIQLGSFSFGNWSSSDGNTLSGSSHSVGSTSFHNYMDSDGTTYTGTTIEIGDFSFTNLSGW